VPTPDRARIRKAVNVKTQENVSTVRATISFPTALYKVLEGIAREKKVSLAWVVRDATEKYVADKWPLFHERD
jgi:metal-responsive CopG/Arc/MetJ family transcriptional regulator